MTVPHLGKLCLKSLACGWVLGTIFPIAWVREHPYVRTVKAWMDLHVWNAGAYHELKAMSSFLPTTAAALTSSGDFSAPQALPWLVPAVYFGAGVARRRQRALGP